MAVRNYDQPDPKRVVANIRRVLETGDMTKLEKGPYQFLATHCGFIAHFNQQGFIDFYRRDMTSFVSTFLEQDGLGWNTFLENPKSYLYDVSYKGTLLADIIQELLPIFQGSRPIIAAEQSYQERKRKEAVLHHLAEELGYTVAPKEDQHGQG